MCIFYARVSSFRAIYNPIYLGIYWLLANTKKMLCVHFCAASDIPQLFRDYPNYIQSELGKRQALVWLCPGIHCLRLPIVNFRTLSHSCWRLTKEVCWHWNSADIVLYPPASFFAHPGHVLGSTPWHRRTTSCPIVPLWIPLAGCLIVQHNTFEDCT